MNNSLPTEKIVEVNTRHGKVRGWASHVFRFAAISAELDAKEQRWIADLRSIGIKLAHPDDGHVRRKDSDICDFLEPCYPQFDDDPKPGDKIALGWHDRYRVREVRAVTYSTFLKCKRYEVLK